MNAKQLFLEDQTPTEFWKCGQCNTVYRDDSDGKFAKGCCTCRTCGFEEPHKHGGYTGICRACSEKRQAEHQKWLFEKAKRISDGNMGDVMFQLPGSDGEDAFFDDPHDALDSCFSDEIELPDFLWVCRLEPAVPSLSVGNIIEGISEEWPESMDGPLDGEEELQKALDAFTEANKKTRLYYNREDEVYLITSEMKREFTDA